LLSPRKKRCIDLLVFFIKVKNYIGSLFFLLIILIINFSLKIRFNFFKKNYLVKKIKTIIIKKKLCELNIIDLKGGPQNFENMGLSNKSRLTANKMGLSYQMVVGVQYPFLRV